LTSKSHSSDRESLCQDLLSSPAFVGSVRRVLEFRFHPLPDFSYRAHLLQVARTNMLFFFSPITAPFRNPRIMLNHSNEFHLGAQKLSFFIVPVFSHKSPSCLPLVYSLNDPWTQFIFGPTLTSKVLHSCAILSLVHIQ